MKHLQSRFSRLFFSQSFVGSSIIFVILSISASALNYTYYPVIAHFLTPAAFGATQSLIAILLQISAIFSGLNLVTIYIVHKFEADLAKQYIEILQKITTTFFVLATIGLTVVQGTVQRFLHIDNHIYLFLVALDLLSSIPFIIAFGFFQAKKRFVAAGSLQLSVVIVKLILGALATKRFGVEGALVGIALGQVGGMILFGILCGLLDVTSWEHKIVSSLKPPSLKELRLLLPDIKNILSMFWVNVILVLFISFDILAARHYFPPSISGLYAGASTLSNVIVFVCIPLIAVLLPSLNTANLAKSKSILLRTSGMVFLVIFGSLIILSLFPRQLLSIFGNEYTAISYLLWRLGIMMSLVAGLGLMLQIGSLYNPLRTAIISLSGLVVLVGAVIVRHQTPLIFVSTITSIFAIMFSISLLQVIWIYSYGAKETV
jgi:O-antigen/teichoic acid export membrane protein